MRKVFHQEKSWKAMVISILFSVGFTLVLFAALPFAHRMAKPNRGLELVKAGAVEIPPEQKEEKPPELPEADKPPEAPPPPDIAEAQQSVPLTADLEVVTGSGGGLAGFGKFDAAAAAAPIKDETFDVSELEKRPEPVSQTAPVYPKELAKAKIEGLVTLVFVLTEDGRVDEPRVENASRPEFEKPALDAVKKWRFRAGEKDGKAVRSYIRIPIRFRVPNG